MVQVITQKSAPSTPDKPIKAITKKRDLRKREEADKACQARARCKQIAKEPTQTVAKEPKRTIVKEPAQAVAKSRREAIAKEFGANFRDRSSATDGATIRKPYNTTLFAV